MSGNVIEGTYTLKQAIHNTYRHFRTRFKNMKRDVIKRITIVKITDLKRERPGEPSVKYQITTRSYPQYAPYLKDGRRQKKIHHDYETVLEMDQLSLNTIHWKATVGTMKKWKPGPQKQVKVIHRDTMTKWIRERDAKLQRARTPEQRNLIREQHKKRIITHKRSAKYYDDGDFNTRVRGINADWIFRCAYAYWKAGHLYGKNYFGNIPARVLNPRAIVFLPKHLIRIVEVLLKQGILKP